MSPHRSSLVLAALCLSLTAGLCAPPVEGPFVLSADERLRSGSYSLQENEISARLDEQGLHVELQLHDDLGLPGSGAIDMSLRDLDDRVFAQGQTGFDSHGEITTIQVQLQPPLHITDPDRAVALVLHARLRINNQDLRFRHSLYEALTASQGEMWLPQHPRPGGLFPLVVQAREDDSMSQIELRMGHALGAVLGAATLSPQGNRSLVLQIPADQPVGETIIASDPSPERPGLIGQVAQLESTHPIDLWTSCRWCGPGDELRIVVALRDKDGSPRAREEGDVCLLDARGVELICHPTRTDSSGLDQQSFFLDAALRDSELQVRAHFPESRAASPIRLAPSPRPEPMLLDMHAFAVDADRLSFDLCGAAPRADLRWHVELHQNNDNGALIAELDLPVEPCPQRIELPLNIESFLVPEHWLLVAGIEDALGRRQALRRWLLPSSSGLVAGLSVPEGLRANRDVAVIVHSRDILGRGLPARGQLRVGPHSYPVHTDAQGRQVLSIHTPDSGPLRLLVDLVDDRGRPAHEQKTQDLLPADLPAAGLSLQIRETGLPIALQQGPLATGSLSSAWLSSRGTLFAAEDLSEGQTELWAPPGNAPLTLHLFYAQAGDPVSAWQQTLLRDQAGTQLVLQFPDPQHLQARLDAGDGSPLSVALISRQDPDSKPSRDQLDVATVREALLRADGETRRAWLASLPPSHAVRAFATRSTPSVSALVVVRARIAQDLEAIAASIRQQIHDGEITAQDLPAWIQRRAHVYFDPWGQPYLLQIQDGRLWLRSGGMDERRPSDDDVQASIYLHRLGVSPASVLGPRRQATRWAAAETPRLLSLTHDGATQQLPLARAQIEVTAMTSTGLVVSKRVDVAPACTLWVPQELALRTLDQVVLPVGISAAPERSIQISVNSSPGLSARLDASTVITDIRGRQAFAISLRLHQRDPQELEIVARLVDGTCRQRIAVRTRDNQAERPRLPGLSIRLGDSGAVSLTLPISSERRGSSFNVEIYDSVAAFRQAVATHLLAQQPHLLQTARLQASVLDAISSTWPHADALLARLNQAVQTNGDVVKLGQSTNSIDAALTLVEASRLIEQHTGFAQALRQRVEAKLLASLDGSGGLTPTGQYGDAQELQRARLRASARLLAAIGADCNDNEACGRLRTYLESQASVIGGDTRSQARLILALLAAGSDPNVVETLVAALLAEQNRDPQAWPFVDSSSSRPGDDALTTALASHALVQAGVSADSLRLAHSRLLSTIAPGSMKQSAEVTEAVLRALADVAEDDRPARVELRYAGSTATLTVESPAQFAIAAAAAEPVTLRTLLGHPVVVLTVERFRGSPPVSDVRIAVQATSPMELQVGQLVALPLQIDAGGLYTQLVVEDATCLATALRIDRHVVHSFAGRVSAVVSGDPAPTVELLLLPLCSGQISRPVVWLRDLQQPWRRGRSSPGLLQISR